MAIPTTVQFSRGLEAITLKFTALSVDVSELVVNCTCGAGAAFATVLAGLA